MQCGHWAGRKLSGKRCCIKYRQRPGIRRTAGAVERLSQRFATKTPKEPLTPAALCGITDRCPAQHRAVLLPWWAAQGHLLFFDTPSLFTTGGILAGRTCSAWKIKTFVESRLSYWERLDTCRAVGFAAIPFSPSASWQEQGFGSGSQLCHAWVAPSFGSRFV